jgi:hypothetical protein
MYYREKVRAAYKECVSLNPRVDAEMRQALNANERTPAFIDNIAIELEKVAALRLKKGKENISDKLIKDIVYDMTEVFIAGLKQQATINYESDLQRVLREQAAQKQKELEQTAEGNISGDYEEFGIIHMTEERSIINGEETGK